MSRTLRKSTSGVSVKRSRSSRKDIHKHSHEEKQAFNVFIISLVENLKDLNADLPVILIDNKPINDKINHKLPHVSFVNKIGSDDVKRIIMKKNSMVPTLLEALKNSINLAATASELKIEYCNLTAEHVEQIHDIVSENQNITYLSLNGNPNTSNYHVLLDNTNLQILSLQLCSIDDETVKLIADKLSNTDNQKLMSLNLSGNLIHSPGAKFIADALRSNRCLGALNLAGNQICETGLIYLLHPLQKFPLKHSEIVFRRHKKMDFLIKVTGFIYNNHQLECCSSLQDTVSVKLSTGSSKKRSETGNKKSSTLLSSVKSDLSLECSHPFVIDCIPENGEIYCSGNNTLMYLNISFNEVTENVVESMIKAVQYQKTAFWFGEQRVGLSRVIVEGSFAESLCGLLEELYILLYPSEKKISSGTMRSASRRSASAVSFR